MSYNIISSSIFDKKIKVLNKKHLSVKTDLSALIDVIKDNPFIGESLGKDCYKIRMAITSKGKGKRGGARIITCVKVVQQNVYLLSIYDKSEKETVEDNELLTLLEAVGLF